MSTLTKRQSDFILHYVESRNTVQSAVNAGYSKSYAKSKSHLLLKHPLIKEQITHLTEKYFKTKFQELAVDAVSTLKDVMQNELSPSSQLQAIKYILNEAGIIEQGSPSQVNIINQNNQVVLTNEEKRAKINEIKKAFLKVDD